MAEDLAFHTGSTLLLPIQRLTGIRVDLINYLFCMLLCILLGFPYRNLLMRDGVSPSLRHLFQVVTGASLLWFCFGLQALHMVLQSVPCYVIMRTMKPGLMEKLVLMLSLGYVFFSHIHRLLYDYGGYTMDVTTPLMVNTQCLSALAFAIADGQTDKDKLTDAKRKQAVTSCPGVLHFASYVLSFQKILCGPFFFYNDYISFIDGRHVPHDVIRNQSPAAPVARNLLSAVCCGLMTVFITPLVPSDYIKGHHFANRGIIYRLSYILVATMLERFRYYTAWKLAAAVNQNVGLGYNGCDDSGQVRWDGTDNVNIQGVELGTSMKVVLDNWNIQTTHWLRYVVYNRTPMAPTLAVFAVSSIWHGLYPGYHVTLLSAAVVVMASRVARRAFRPFFQTSPAKAQLYDVITFISTRLGLSYITFPFVILEFTPSISVYTGLFFYYHVLCLAAVILLPGKPRPKVTATNGVPADKKAD